MPCVIGCSEKCSPGSTRGNSIKLGLPLAPVGEVAMWLVRNNTAEGMDLSDRKDLGKKVMLG